MALTAKKVLDRGVVGRRFARTMEVTFGLNYPTGGEPFGPRDVELSSIELVEFSHVIRGGAHSTDQIRWDGVGSKLQLFTILGAELANLSDQTLLKGYIRVLGRR